MSKNRNSSGRMGALRLLWSAEHVDGHETYADADGDVGDVARRQAVVLAAPLHVRVDEVDDVRVADAIHEVAESAPEDEGQAPPEGLLVRGEPPVERHDERDGERRDERKNGRRTYS